MTAWDVFSPAGTLSLDTFVGAIYHASTALACDATVPGIARPVAVADMHAAALLAVEPYCDGDRIGAAEAIADALTSGWRIAHPQARETAVAEGNALLVWLERFDPALN